MLQCFVYSYILSLETWSSAGILETPQLLCSQHCLIRDLWKSLCAKEKGVDRNKLFTVTQNYLTGKFSDKLLFKSPCFGTNWEEVEAVFIYIVKYSF